MAKPFTIPKEDIEKMIQLKNEGYSNQQIADIFNIAKSTLWDNIYRHTKGESYSLRNKSKVVVPKWERLEIAKLVIAMRRKEGKNSRDVAEELQIPLQKVNKLWFTTISVNIAINKLKDNAYGQSYTQTEK
jgi:predicted DNA-binding protein YlxM (UPF0122 family)